MSGLENEEFDCGDSKEQSNGDNITITVKNISDDKDDYTVNINDTISKFIQDYIKANKLTGVKKIILHHKGKSLKPESTFKENQIEDGSDIKILVRLIGGY